MRPIAFIPLVLSAGISHAQLINGSFENNGAADLTGWTSLCNAMNSSPDVPGGTGNWSITIPQIDHWNCPQDFVYQQVPFVHGGDIWNLGAWTRTDEPAQLGMNIRFVTRNGGVFQDIPAAGFGTDQTTWSHQSGGVYISCDPADSVYLVLDAGNAFPDSTYGNVWFDDITLTPISTGSTSVERFERPAFRPNPTTDKLWVDLAEAPTSIELYDALGARLPDPMFTRNARTLEVRCASLNTGIHFLVMRTDSGSKSIRFIKQ